MDSNFLNAEKILQCLIENLDEGIQIVDCDGKTIYYNRAMGKVEGIEPSKVLGKKVNEYLVDVKDDDSTLMNVLKTGEKIVDLIQHYGNEYKQEVTTINTTVPVTIDNKVYAVIEIAKDMTQLKELTESICKLQNSDKKSHRHYTFNDIYGDSPSIKSVIEKAKKASMSNSSVLLYAETGSGKEVFSQSIHYGGIRKDKPFIPINCAAIPAPLLEGMLFGTEKGGFTGAENKKGLFQEANHGTILLDEVNSLEPYLQSKLLRVLQEGNIRPIGGNKSIDIDVRIIATLNEEPEKLIESGKLRKDFYYRLGVLRIDIPALRDRKGDIPVFVEKLIEKYNKILMKNIRGIDEVMMAKLQEYNWPGNIRELKNVIEAAINMADNNSVLTENYFDARISNKSCLSAEEFMENIGENFQLEDYIGDMEKRIIEKIFRKNKGNVSKTSRELSISRQNLQYKLKRYKITSL
ncbi:MAG: sigma 54-interacting transcriptional regulator [Clostridiaceae bacterium]|nr:sigma 54-interacting transcriptional regulator [Clostridiaceae bacterium]